MFIKNFKCIRCNLTWSKEAFDKMKEIDKKRFLSKNGCPLCYNESWYNGHYLGD